jgi:hypothetical protein
MIQQKEAKGTIQEILLFFGDLLCSFAAILPRIPTLLSAVQKC